MKIRYFLLLLVMSPSPVMAEDLQSGVSLSLGYRLDSLDWNISGGSSGPNVLSELEWRDMDILQLKGAVSGANGKGIYFRGFVDYGWVLDGVNQDSDYAGDDRTLEFSRSINDVDGSRVLDLSAGLGYTFYLGESDRYRIIPILGYSHHNQKLRMTNGNQVVPALGPFPGLSSSYNAKWFGPWLGVDVLLDLQGAGSAFVRMEVHQATYFGYANWNLRSDFAHPVSFEHEADAQGWVLELGWHQPPSRYRWVWGVTASLQSWTTDAGIDRIFFANGSVGTTRLNEVNWSSSSVNLSLSKAFDG